MGPYYALTDALGLPDWVAQRLWVGGLQLAAALGALALFRHLLPRTWVHVPAAAAYGLSPFVLGHVTSQSGLLVPFAGLGLARARAWPRRVESPRSWRWPAAFALDRHHLRLAQRQLGVLRRARRGAVGAVRGARTAVAPRRRDGAARARARRARSPSSPSSGGSSPTRSAVATTSRSSRSPRRCGTTNATTSAPEVLRGLGLLVLLRRRHRGPVARATSRRRTRRSGLLLVVTFAIPILALAAGRAPALAPPRLLHVLVGDRHGRSPSVPSRSATRRPPGRALRAAQPPVRRSCCRSATRSAPAPSSPSAWPACSPPASPRSHRRHAARRGRGGARRCSCSSPAALPAQWRTGLVAERFHRDEDLPAAWTRRGRPTSTQGDGPRARAARLGLRHLPVGRHARPRVGRASPTARHRPRAGAPRRRCRAPTCSRPSTAACRRAGSSPAALAPVARLLGATDVLVRNDLEYERYRTVRPRAAGRCWQPRRTGSTPRRRSATRYENVAGPGPPDDRRDRARARHRRADPPADRHLRRARTAAAPRSPPLPVGGGIVIDGDGEGVVSAAAAGLLDGAGAAAARRRRRARRRRSTPSPTATPASSSPTPTASAPSAGTRSGRTPAPPSRPTQTVVLDDPSDARLEVAGTTPARHPDRRRVARRRAGLGRRPTASQTRLVPEERPVNAFDGDLTTAWRSERGADGTRRRIGRRAARAERGRPHHARRPAGPPRHGDRSPACGHPRRRAAHRRRRSRPTRAGPTASRSPLDGEPFTRLEVEILGPPVRRPRRLRRGADPGRRRSRSWSRLPTALLDELGSGLAGHPVAIVLSRQRANPAEPLRADPEPAMARLLDAARRRSTSL